MNFLQILVLLVAQGLLVTADEAEEWFRAVKTGDTTVVNRMLSQNPENINLTSCDRFCEWTALHFASSYDQKEVVKLLIVAGANIEATDEDNKTVLHVAAELASSQIVQLLINAGANVEATDIDGKTPLHRAAASNDFEVVQLLIDAGANLEVADQKGYTPLILAASRSNPSYEIVKLLIIAGADIEAKVTKGQNALHCAVSHKTASVSVVEALLDAGAKLEAKDNYKKTALHYAAQYNSGVVAQKFVDTGANIEAKDYFGNTAMHCAARYDSGAVLQILVDAGANIEATDYDKKTALHYAAHFASSAVVQVLLDAGADFQTTDEMGKNVLHHAAAYNSKDVVQLLLDKGANIEAKDEDGNTALFLAITHFFYPSESLVQILVDAGADLEAKNRDGSTALLLAVTEFPRANVDFVQILVEAGADLEAKDRHGNTALYLAITRFHNPSESLVQILVDAGADLEAKDDYGSTALHLAITRYHNLSESLVQILVDAGADLEAKDRHGNTALHLAMSCDNQCESLVRILVDAGADLEAKDRHGNTALHSAVKYHGSYQSSCDHHQIPLLEVAGATNETIVHRDCPQCGIVQLLVDVGADIEAKDSYGQTVLMTAARRGPYEFVKILIDAGANLEAADQHHGATVLYHAADDRYCSEIKVLMLICAGASFDIVRLLKNWEREHDSEYIKKLTEAKKVLPMVVRQNNVDDIEFLIENGNLIEIYNSTGAKTPLYWALLNTSMEVLLMEDVDWNAQIHHDQSIFNPINISDVILETTISSNDESAETDNVESNVYQDQRPEVVYCTNLTPGLKRFASGIDITTLDLFPLDSTKFDGFKKPVLDYTCNKGRTWKDDENVFDIPDQIDALQRVSTGWTHANVEIFRSRDEVKMSMSENVLSTGNKEKNLRLKTPKFSIFGFNIGSLDLKLYEEKGSFSRSHSVRKMSEEIEKQNKTIAKATSFISIYKAIVDTESLLEPNQRFRSAIDDLPLSVNYYNLQLYMDFIEKYGTHYFAEAKFGGYLMQITSISSLYASKHSDEHLKKEESNFFRKKTLWMNEEKTESTETDISNDEKEAHEEFRKNAEEEMYFYGGDPKAKNLEWFESVSGSPWLFSGKLEPIYKLIENEQKQQSMKIALVAYMKNGRAAELGPLFDVEICAFAFGDGCSASRDNCASVNQWTLPVTFREGTGSQCRMNWKLKAASPANWMKQRVKFCFKYSAETNSNCSGSDYHPSWRIETADKVKTILSSPANDKGTKALINCADVNDWTSNYIHYNGEGCKMTWSLFAVGDEDSDIPEWLSEFYFCWRTLTFEGSYTIDCAPLKNRYFSHFYKEGGQEEGGQMEWGLFAQDLSTENHAD